MDLTKGLAMLAIVAGHLGSDVVTRFVFTFHVPIFFLISGYFYKYRNGIVQDRAKGLFKPYVITGIIMVAVAALKSSLKVVLRGNSLETIIDAVIDVGGALLYGSGSQNDLLDLTIQPIGAIWFLPALLWSILLLTLFIKIAKAIKVREEICILVCSVVMFAVGYLSAKETWLPLSIQSGACGVLFLSIGYIYKLHKYDVMQKIRCVLTAVLVTVWIAAIYRSYTNINMSLVRCYFPDLVLNVAGAIGGSIAVAFIAKGIDKKEGKINQFINFWGTNSLLVLCIHNVERTFLPYDKLKGFISAPFLCHSAMFTFEAMLITCILVVFKKMQGRRASRST